VTELAVSETLDKSHPSTIGLGLYPTVSLLNHSCDPAAELIFYDDRCAVRAVQTIRSGRELTIDYGYVYYTMPADKRRRALRSQYFFDCRCDACAGNWSLKAALPTGTPTIKCAECGTPLLVSTGLDGAAPASGDQTAPTSQAGSECPEVRSAIGTSGRTTHVELEGSQAKAERAIKDARKLRIDKAVTGALEGHLTILERDVRLPCKDYAVCLSTLKQCYRMQGNRAHHQQ
jgi:hypothetical protein